MFRKKEEIQTPKKEIDIENQMEQLKRKLEELENKPVTVQSPVSAKKRIEVVKELPVQPIRRYKDEEGNVVELITIEEALNLIVNS